MKQINWKLIFGLSLIGLAMAFATTYLGIMKYEWAIWIPILLLNSFLVAKFCSGSYFLNGFAISLANCVWITGIHILLMDVYLMNNPDYITMLQDMPMPTRPRVMALMMGPIVGIIFGIVQGALSWGASKMFKK